MTPLKDRIQITENGFKVLPDVGKERSLYYGTFTLADDPGTEPRLIPASYWDPVHTREVTLKEAAFIEAAEKKQGKVTERHRFYYPGRGAKPELGITVKANRKYKTDGGRAFFVTIEWISGSADPINGRYLYVTDPEGEKFYFLTGLVRPKNTSRGIWTDSYVYTVPEGEDEDRYYVDADPLVKEKYRIR